ncbi:MAG: ankyrin [Sphingomonas bacterium]|nr:ankyrin [Sphingomonas bacterium]
MKRPTRMIIAALAAALATTPAAAQFSDSYKFLKAVKEADGAKVNEALDAPGTTIINTRDYASGEGALHIVVKRRDMTWLAFLLAKGANPNVRDGAGNTPLALAAQLGYADGVQQLLERRASVDLENSSGETPLIIAVHNRDVPTARLLVAAGASPTRADRIAGKSARDYATEDRRAAPILKILDEAKTAKPSAKMSGPSL